MGRAALLPLVVVRGRCRGRVPSGLPPPGVEAVAKLEAAGYVKRVARYGQKNKGEKGEQRSNEYILFAEPGSKPGPQGFAAVKARREAMQRDADPKTD